MKDKSGNASCIDARKSLSLFLSMVLLQFAPKTSQFAPSLTRVKKIVLSYRRIPKKGEKEKMKTGNKIIGLCLCLLILSNVFSGGTVAASDGVKDTYIVNKGGCYVKNGTHLIPHEEKRYFSEEEAVYTVRSVWENGPNDDIAGFMVDGKFEEGTLNEDGSRTYTFPKGTIGEHFIYGVTKSEIYHNPFHDVAAGDWFYNDVVSVNRKGLMTGLDSYTFAPMDPLARAQFIVILYRMAGKPAIDTERLPKVALLDVDFSQNWYYDAVIWGLQNYIMMGYKGVDLWGIADHITREQMITAMYRYAKYKNYDVDKKTDISKFEDADSVSSFAKSAMKWAVAAGIVTGKDNGTKLDPQGCTTRAECAAIIQRFIMKYK